MAAASIVIEILAKTASFETDAKRAEKSLKNLEKQLKDTRRATDGYGDAFGNVGKELKQLGALSLGGFGVASIVQSVDAYTKFTAQLKLATNNAIEFDRAYKSVTSIARESQSDIESVGTLYARLSRSMKSIGIESRELNDITRTISLGLRVSGATAKETASTLLQLSQAFGAGRLNGQEFAAVAEAAPILLEQLAKTIGVNIGELKKLGAEGKLTRESLKAAFTDQSFLKSLEAQTKEVGTISSAFTVFRNNLTLYIGEADKANGASALVREGILALADSFEAISTAVLVLAGASLGKYIKSVQLSVAASKLKQIEIIKEQVIQERAAQAALKAAQAEFALGRVKNANLITYNKTLGALNENVNVMAAVAQRTTAAAKGLATLRNGFALLGGPIGIGITALILFGDKLVAIGKEALGITPALEKITEEMERQAKLRNLGVNAKDPNADEIASIKELQKQLTEAKKKREELNAIVESGNNKPTNLKEFTARFAILGFGGAENADEALAGVDAVIKKLEKEIKEANESLKIKPKVETPEVDSDFVKNLKEQIIEIANVNKLLGQGIEMDDAAFIAKAKLGGANDELIVTYLNLKNAQDSLNDAAKEEKNTLAELNKLRLEEIPTLKLINSLVGQGVEMDDAQVIAKLKLKGVSDELIVSYLNEKNAQESLIETQKRLNEAFDTAKKLNESGLSPLDSFIAKLAELNALQKESGLNQQGYLFGLREAVDAYDSASNAQGTYKSTLQELNDLYQESNKVGIDTSNDALELTIAYKELEEQLVQNIITFDEFINKRNELVESGKKSIEDTRTLTDILSNTSSAKLEEQRADIALLYEEYAKGADGAIPSIEALGEAVDVVLGRTAEQSEDVADFMQSAFKRAAENMQDAFADFLFDPFKDGLDGMLMNFLRVLDRMAAEAAAAAIMKKLFESTGSTGGADFFGNILGKVGDFFGGFFANGGTPPMNKISVVGEKGPELFVPNSAGRIIPNNMLNGNTNNSKSVSVQNNFTVNGTVDRRSQEQISVQVGLAVNRALARNR